MREKLLATIKLIVKFLTDQNFHTFKTLEINFAACLENSSFYLNCCCFTFLIILLSLRLYYDCIMKQGNSIINYLITLISLNELLRNNSQ